MSTLSNIKFANFEKIIKYKNAYIWPPDCPNYSKIGMQTRLMDIKDSLSSNLPVQNFFLEKNRGDETSPPVTGLVSNNP